MSISGFFELNINQDTTKLIDEVKKLGFPCAEIEKVEGFNKGFLLSLQAFARVDNGNSEALLEDLVKVTKFLISKSSDKEVLYSQDLDLRNPEYTKIIKQEEIRKYPPELSGFEGLYIIRED